MADEPLTDADLARMTKRGCADCPRAAAEIRWSCGAQKRDQAVKDFLWREVRSLIEQNSHLRDVLSSIEFELRDIRDGTPEEAADSDKLPWMDLRDSIYEKVVSALE